jgi:hypothetical protein
MPTPTGTASDHIDLDTLGIYEDSTLSPEDLDEESQKKIKQQEQQKQQEEQAALAKQKEQQQQPKNNPVQELGTAVVGAGIDLVEGVGATAQGLVQGELLNPDFKPTWLQVDDKVEPMNQTVWGNILRSIGEFGLGFAATGGLGHLGKASKIPGLVQAGRYLADPKTTKIGQAVQGTVKSALVTFSNSNAEADSIANQVKEVMPWFPTITDFDDDASPLEKRAKNVLEDIGLGAVTEVLLGLRAGKQAANAIDAGKVKVDFDPQKVAAELEVLKRNVADADAAGLLEAPETLKQIQRMEKLQKKLDDFAMADPDVAKEVAQANVRADQDFATRDAVQLEFELDPVVSRPRPAIHPDYFDLPDKGFRTVAPGSHYQAMKDMLRMAADGSQEMGRRARLVTDAAIDRMGRSNPEMKKQLQAFAEEIQAGLEIPAGQNVAGLRTNLDGVRQMAVAKYLDIMDMNLEKADWEDLRVALLEDSIEVPNVLGGKTQVMNSSNAMALEMLMYDLNTAVADKAAALHSVVDKVPIEEGLNSLLSKVESAFLMNQEASEFAGSLLRARRGDTIVKKTGAALASVDKQKQISKFVGELKDVIMKDPEMTQAFLRAFAESNGEVHSLEALRRYAADHVFNLQSVVGGKKSAFIEGAFTTLYNSILSAPKTLARAFSGTNLLTVLRPLQTSLGGALSGDMRQMQKGAYMAFDNMFGTISEAWAMAKNTHYSLINNLDGAYANQIISPTERAHWQSLGAVIERSGNLGEKMAYRLTNTMMEFNNQSWVRYPSNAMQSIDAFSKTILGRQELKAQAFDAAWNKSGGNITKEMLQQMERDMYREVFDNSGKVIDLAAKRAGQEVALQIPLTGKLAQFDKFLQDVPLARPFFLFMKTGWNALEVVGKHTPIIARFNGEVNAILKATPDSLDEVLKYGIDTPEKLAQARALVTGRVATGYMTVGGALGLYTTGRLSGNGPADKETRNAWLKTGWKPRSIKVGDTWINYDGLEPFASFLAAVADVGDNVNTLGEVATENWYRKLGYIIAMNVTNKSFLSGLQPLTQIISGAQGAGAEVWLGNMINNFVPYGGARNELANIFNPGMRELEKDLWDTIKNRNPFLRGTLPYAVDPLDGSIVRDWDFPTRMWNSISPIQMSGKDTDTRRLLRDSGFDLVTTFGTDSNGTPLNPTERSEMAALMGKYNIEGQLTELFKHPQIRQDIEFYRQQREAGVPGATKDDPKNLDLSKSLFMTQIASIFNTAKKSAQAEMYQKYPSLLQRGELKAIKEHLQKQGDHEGVIKVQQEIDKLLSNENR